MVRRGIGVLLVLVTAGIGCPAQELFDRGGSPAEALAFIGAPTGDSGLVRGTLADAEHRAFGAKMLDAWTRRDATAFTNLLSRAVLTQQPDFAATWCKGMAQGLLLSRDEQPKVFITQGAYDPQDPATAAQARYKTQIETPSEFIRFHIFTRKTKTLFGRELVLVREQGDLRLTLELPKAPGVSTIPVVTPKPALRAVTNTAVYFECRGDEVFRIDRDGLMTQLQEALRGPDRSPEKLMASQRGDDTYVIDGSSYALSVLMLKPRGGAHGETAAQLERPDGAFRAALRQLDRTSNCLVFFVRPDSSNVCLKARTLAEDAGFKIGRHPLAADVTLAFASRGMEEP